MFGIENISLNLSFSPVLFFAGLILIAGYTVYNYRYTVPQVSTPFRMLLVALRTLALLMILFVIFEPVLSLTRRNVIEPVNLIFIDDSKSIRINDGTNRMQNVQGFLEKLSGSDIAPNSELFRFGSGTGQIPIDSTGRLSFNEPSTNFARLFSSIKAGEKNIASIVVVSDGVITDGPNPVFQAEKLGIPVYTLGVGDTTSRNNVSVKRVLSNEYIYAGTPTAINASIGSSGFTGRTVTVTLYDEGRMVEQQNITLADGGITNAAFTYTPANPGEKKLTLDVSAQPGEFTAADNRKVFYVNVLDNKLNTLILAGSPSPDLAFIKTSLKNDENLKVNTITQIGPNKFLENGNFMRQLDSARVLFLVGFPSPQTPAELYNRVIQEIRAKNKPYFIILSSGVDLNRLKQLQQDLPFTITRISNSFSNVQPDVSNAELQNPLLQTNARDVLNAWNNLPPVLKNNSEFQAKPESEVLAKVRINNIPLNSPLILTRKLGNKRGIAVLAKDIWRWKLEKAEQKLDVFDRMVVSSVRWLDPKENKKLVNVKTTRKTYSLGEPVEFTAEVYDETFTPISDAEINVAIKSGSNSYTLNMNALENGLYEGTFEGGTPGDYSFTGTAKLNGQTLGTDAGKFNIGDVEIEMINQQADKEFLSQLALQTGGRFFYGNNYSSLFEILKNNQVQRSKEKLNVSEFVIWANEWMLIAIVLLFAAEWFLRKRAGML